MGKIKFLERQSKKHKTIPWEVKTALRGRGTKTPFSIFGRTIDADNKVGEWLAPCDGQLLDVVAYADLTEYAELMFVVKNASGIGVAVNVPVQKGVNSVGTNVPVAQGDLISVCVINLRSKKGPAEFNSLGVTFTLDSVLG